MFSCEYCGIFKINFEEHLWTAASIRCYFDKINLKQSGFCTIYSFKALVSERKDKNNLKNCASQKKIFYNSHIIYNVYEMFYYKIQWFYQDFKSESVLSSCSENTGPVTRDHVKCSQMCNETPLQLYRLFLHAWTGIFLLFRRMFLRCAR